MTIAKLPMLVAILLSTVARAEDAPATIDKLFPSRAPISVAQAGIARLALFPEILGACRGDLGDMRIVDGKGNEVAYVVDSGLDPASRLQVLATKEAAVLNVKREEEPRENASPIARETFEIEAPAPGGDDSRWELRIKTGRAKFVRRLEVRAVGSNGEVTPLVQGESIFRLPLGVGQT